MDSFLAFGKVFFAYPVSDASREFPVDRTVDFRSGWIVAIDGATKEWERCVVPGSVPDSRQARTSRALSSGRVTPMLELTGRVRAAKMRPSLQPRCSNASNHKSLACCHQQKHICVRFNSISHAEAPQSFARRRKVVTGIVITTGAQPTETS
jgi:hypothetical protein